MSAGDALLAVAQGRASAALLHTCRLDAFGTSFRGEEAVLHALRQDTDAVAEAEILVGDRHAALFTDRIALFADLFDGRIGRLWRVGPGSPRTAVPRVQVAFDPDLAQARGGLFLRADDHPELRPDALAPVEAAADAILAAERTALRTRLFLIRGFSSGEEAVAMFARYRLEAGETLGFSYAVARCPLGGGDARVLADDVTG